MTRRSDETGWLEHEGRRLFLNRDEVSVHRTALLRVEKAFRNAMDVPLDAGIRICLPGGTAWDDLRQMSISYEVTPLPFDLMKEERVLLFLGGNQRRDGLDLWHILGEEAKYQPDGEGSFVRKQVYPHHEGPYEVVHTLSMEELIRHMDERPYDPVVKL